MIKSILLLATLLPFLVVGCVDEEKKTYPPVDVVAVPPGGLSVGQSSSSSSGALDAASDASGDGGVCVPVFDLDGGTFDVDVTSNLGGAGTLVGTISLPSVADPNARAIMSLLDSTSAQLDSINTRLVVSKGAYSYRIRGVPSRLLRLRVDIDATTDNSVGGIGDYRGVYTGNPLDGQTDVSLARTIDTSVTCSNLALSVDLLRN